MALTPERLVFLDETSVTPPLTPLGGRSLKGTRVQGTAPFGGWTTQTFIAGLSNTGLGAPWLISAAMEGPAFTKYSAEVLAPEVEPGTLSSRTTSLPTSSTQPRWPVKRQGGSYCCRHTGVTFPNRDGLRQTQEPSHLRGAPTFTDVFDALAQAWELYTHHQCINSFRHARYASTSLKIALNSVIPYEF